MHMMALCVAKRNAMCLYEAADVIDSDVGESIRLCLREAAVCDLVNACEEAFAARGNALLAAQDAAEIDIHVVLHHEYVCAFAVTLSTGTMALPVGVPRPVVKTMTLQPAATIEVTEEMS